jgi:hypothetical protein
MSENRNHPEHLLLDWHLNRLEGEERSWIEQELRRDAALSAKSDQLRRVLEPLDSWQVPRPPAHLADKVLAFIRQSKGQWDTSLPFEPPALKGDTRERAWPFFRLREMVAVAACVMLLAGVMVPGISEMRGRSQRAVCAGNLGSIFRGLSAYRADHGESLPYAGAATAWLPGENRDFASNSRHAFLLAKLNFVPDLSSFLCPGDGEARPMAAEQRAAFADFAASENLSYDSLNLAGKSPNVRPATSVAYLGDRNPLFIGGRFNETVDPDHTNSPAHRGRGQTVLTLDGTAQFARTPIFGTAKDNVWIVNGVRSYTGAETPTQRNDSFLVPGFPAH